MLRIGFGYDVHVLAEGIPLVLGGVAIPSPKGLESHSDGDVLLHAVMDALLGAACLGDIGAVFPDTDPAYQSCSSLKLLAQVKAMMHDAGFALHNLDCTVVAQRPKILPYIPEMRASIRESLDVTMDRVNVKATTTEGLGFAGREEGIACYAVCTLSERGARALPDRGKGSRI